MLTYFEAAVEYIKNLRRPLLICPNAQAETGITSGFLLLWLQVSDVIATSLHPCFITVIKFGLHIVFALSAVSLIIMKTYLYNFDPPPPLKSHFYIVKLEFTGVYIIFLICAWKYRLWVLVRTASPRRFERVPTIYVFKHKYEKHQNFFIWKFSFLKMKFSIILNRRVFEMLG